LLFEAGRWGATGLVIGFPFTAVQDLQSRTKNHCHFLGFLIANQEERA
jgi:hypothetical protein